MTRPQTYSSNGRRARRHEPLETLELEWEEELNRNSAEYIRWVQASLNRLSGLQLDVDGISGPITRSAVRDFQARRGLLVDGIVGPQTERALIAAGARPPGSSAATTPPPPAAYLPPGSYPRSPDGTPLFRQGDPTWGDRLLESRLKISTDGCALTSMAMALSKISGRLITPLALDEHLDTNSGYGGANGDWIIWDTAARIVGLHATKTKTKTLNFTTIDAQLAAGRPVVIGVDKSGLAPGASGTDHWIAVTARSGAQYLANDPADGRQITLSRSGDVLFGPKNYKSTGELVVVH